MIYGSQYKESYETWLCLVTSGRMQETLWRQTDLGVPSWSSLSRTICNIWGQLSLSLLDSLKARNNRNQRNTTLLGQPIIPDPLLQPTLLVISIQMGCHHWASQPLANRSIEPSVKGSNTPNAMLEWLYRPIFRAIRFHISRRSLSSLTCWNPLL